MSHYYKPGVSEYPPRIVCHVCGLEGPADYPLYMSPHGFTGHKSPPFFPFLKELEPPVGCRAPDNRESAVFSCRQVIIASHWSKPLTGQYSFLYTQQYSSDWPLL